MKRVIAYAGLAFIPSNLATAQNPDGHHKLLADYDPIGATAWPWFSPATRSYPVVVLQNGATVFGEWNNERIYSGFPGNVSVPITKEQNTGSGRTLTSFDSLYYNIDYSGVSNNGVIVLRAKTKSATDPDGVPTILLYKNGVYHELAREGRPAPGGGAYYRLDYYGQVKVSNDGEFVVFRANTSGGPGVGLYSATFTNGAPVVKLLVGTGTPAPGGGGFNLTSDPGLAYTINSQRNLIFFSPTTQAAVAWYFHNGTSFSTIPGTDRYDAISINDANDVVAAGSKIKLGTPSGVSQVADQFAEFKPGWKFDSFRYVTLDRGKRVTFAATIRRTDYTGSDEGIFDYTPGGGMKTIALKTDLPPGGGLFRFIHHPLGCYNGFTYFLAETFGGPAIYRGNGSTLMRMIGTGDFLEDRAVTDLVSSWPGKSGVANQIGVNASGQFAYYATFGGLNGYFVYSKVESDSDHDGISDAWETAMLEGTGHGPDSDEPDHDSTPLLLEYFFGMNPTLPDTPKLSTRRINNDFMIEFPKREDTSTLNHEVQWNGSLNPGGWTTAPAVFEKIAENGEVDTWRARVPVNSTEQRKFFRLHVAVKP